jgi:hypothetical protein
MVVAALADFSAVVLAAIATSQAFWEASSSASRDAMRALAITKASVAWQSEKENQVENQKKISETGRRYNIVKKNLTLKSSGSIQELDAFSAQSGELLHENL